MTSQEKPADLAEGSEEPRAEAGTVSGSGESDADSGSMDKKLEELAQLHEASRAGGGAAAVERQHARNKLTAHERIERLFDPDSFVELDALATPQRPGIRPGRVDAYPATP